MPEPRSRPTEAPGDRPGGKAKSIGGLGVGQAFKVAQNNRGAVEFGKAVEFIIEHSAEVAAVDLAGRVEAAGMEFVGEIRSQVLKTPLAPGMPPDAVAGVEREPTRHGAEPGSNRPLPGNFPGSERQHKKGGLNDVLGVVLARQNPSTGSADLGQVPTDDHGEGRVFPAQDKSFDQGRVVHGVGDPRTNGTQRAKGKGQRASKQEWGNGAF